MSSRKGGRGRGRPELWMVKVRRKSEVGGSFQKLAWEFLGGKRERVVVGCRSLPNCGKGMGSGVLQEVQ